MCMTVYLASDVPLPTIPWEQSTPAFNVADLRAPDESVRKQFSKPHVYYVGSHEGCGCGFQHGQYPGFEEPDNIAAAVRSRRELTDYIRRALATQDSVELFSCWDGDQSAAPEFRDRLSIDQLATDRTYFREKEHLLITR
jgi:hypothetical protein